MKQQQNNSVLPWVLLAAPVLWMGAVLAYAYEDGMTLFELLPRFAAAMDHPFAIGWTPYTLKFMLGALVVYGFAATMYLTSKQNRRPGEEHGSAHWGNVYQLDRKYRDKNVHNNVILSQHIHMSLNGRQHLRNLLQIVVGGSGAGKTRYVVKPNIYEANASYIATDPKGELARAAIPLLLREGYVIRVIDL
ncbi:MAG: type IV secretory system conjugative DNA transfer family protein, partial [Oscillospiraceae bacterium]|nr:type IV secretory system conjugative DNA transfer family protein [Oscillospiraceae bacterium]